MEKDSATAAKEQVFTSNITPARSRPDSKGGENQLVGKNELSVSVLFWLLSSWT